MKDCEKIKLLKELLGDKDLLSQKEEPKGVLSVEAEGDSPEDAKEKMLSQLKGIDLPDEEEMEEVMPEEEEMDYEDEMGMEEEEYDEDYDEEILDEEDQSILEALPEKTRAQFKKRLFEKIKSL